ncbi:MAG TPA: hypothetical protein GX714_13195 [Chloroflexi bacterium]|nr:hypothetical protein [Chloroflexota bacterium]
MTYSPYPPRRPLRRYTSGHALRAGTLLVLWALVLLGIVGCASPVVRQQAPPMASAVWLEGGATIGQTFVAHHAGLAAFDVYVTPEGAPGELVLHLTAPDGPEARIAARGAVPEAEGWVRLAFAPLVDSRQCYYAAELAYEGSGGVHVATAPGDAYLHGALAIDGAPQDAQLAFRLVFDRRTMLAGLAALVAASWVPIGLAGALLLLAPGLALLALAGSLGTAYGWPGRLGLAAGLSAALHPLLFLLADLVGLRLVPAYSSGVCLAALGGLLVWWWRDRRRGGRWRRPLALSEWVRSDAVWPDVALVGVLGLVTVTRFLPIGSLEAPMWGDAYQHTAIVRLLVDRGGLFQDWRPYADLYSFTYHYGFHALAAALHWLTGLGATDATLWMGQILNVLAVLALYPLAVRVAGNRWAGVGAVLVAGLLAPMPMHYLNWGRYTQLAGQVILPVLACLCLDALDAPPGGHRGGAWRLLGLAMLALAGLSLTHYRVLLLAAPLFLGVLAFSRRAERGRRLGRMALLGGGALLLTLPWHLRVLTGKISAVVWDQVVASTGPHPVMLSDLGAVAANVSAYLPVAVWLALPLAVGWGLWRRGRVAAVVALWWFGAFLLVNPQLLHLPGAGTITNFALFIALYIPAAVLLGAALGWGVVAWKTRVAPVVAALVVLGGGAWGATQRLAQPNPAAHALVTRPDVRAAQWIARNTPDDARFLVNSFFAYEGSSVVGSDAGWWLPLLAGRATTLPPLTYVSEEGPRPAYRLWVNGLTAALQGVRLDDAELLAALREHGVTHVYIGQRQGRVNYSGPDVLDPARLADSALFRPIYHQDRVWVFEFLGR